MQNKSVLLGLLAKVLEFILQDLSGVTDLGQDPLMADTLRFGLGFGFGPWTCVNRIIGSYVRLHERIGSWRGGCSHGNERYLWWWEGGLILVCLDLGRTLICDVDWQYKVRYWHG